jgi:sodium pump decarboxylase gamma subunit
LSSDFSTGLVVSGVGLLITFTALLIFIGVIMALKAIFPYKEEAGEDEVEEVTAAVSDGNDEELAAAIAAVLHLRKRRSSQLGSALSEGKSSFWTSD